MAGSKTVIFFRCKQGVKLGVSHQKPLKNQEKSQTVQGLPWQMNKILVMDFPPDEMR